MSPVSTTFQSPKDCSISEDTAGFMRKWAPSSTCEQDQFGKKITVTSFLLLMGWVFEKEERMQDSVRWSFDVLLIDKWIDRECQIGFCPLQEKRERERGRIMERRCHAAALYPPVSSSAAAITNNRYVSSQPALLHHSHSISLLDANTYHPLH